MGLDEQVADFIYRGEWNLGRLNRKLPEHIVVDIIKVVIGKIDTPFWCGNEGCSFSTKEAWRSIRSVLPVNVDLDRLWHNSIPIKISMLNWRLALNLLPVDIKMRDYGICGPSKCQCCMQEETINHVFLNSNFAKEVWAYFNSMFGMPDVDFPNIYALWNEWRTHHVWNTKGHIRTIVPLIICWAIWEARNDAKHANSKMDYKKTIVRIEMKMKMLIKANLITKKNCKGEALFCQSFGIQWKLIKNRRDCIVQWSKPVRGCLKLNVDGCSKGNPGLAAAGGILRDFLGKVILSFSKGLGYQNSYNAELLALLEGVEIATKIGCHNIWIEMDSKVLVTQVTKGYLGDWKSFPIFFKLYKMLEQMTWKCTHIWREANSAADYMANMGINSPSLRIDYMAHLSGHLKGITTLDRLGIPYIRCLKDA